MITYPYGHLLPLPTFPDSKCAGCGRTPSEIWQDHYKDMEELRRTRFGAYGQDGFKIPKHYSAIELQHKMREEALRDYDRIHSSR